MAKVFVEASELFDAHGPISYPEMLTILKKWVFLNRRLVFLPFTHFCSLFCCRNATRTMFIGQLRQALCSKDDSSSDDDTSDDSSTSSHFTSVELNGHNEANSSGNESESETS